jgi:DNA-binding MltR family transcriptional regulator
MPELENQAEIDAFYLSDPAHPRAAGVLWPALIERRIDKLFDYGFRPDKTVWNELFQPSGALGNYAVKVRLAYMLGWFAKDFYDDLLILAKIRNRFAHSIEAKDFTDQHISGWLKNMKSFQMLPGMLERFKARAAKPDASRDEKAAAYVLANVVADPQSSFRQCISMMLHQLDRCSANMHANLEKLAPNWMTADPVKPTPKSEDGNTSSEKS